MSHQAFLQSLSPDERARLTQLRDAPGLWHGFLHFGMILLLAIGVGTGAPGWPILLLLLGVLLVCLFHLLHEVTHETVFATKRLNIWAARISGFVLLIPPRWFRYFHFAHHKHTHDPDHDPELATPKPRTRRGYVLAISGLPLWRSLFLTLWTNARGKCADTFVPDRARAYLTHEARLMLAGYALLIAGSVVLGSTLLIWIWILPLLVAQPLLRLYLMAEHTNCEHVSDMFVNTRTVFTAPVVRWLAWNMPFHAEHHAFPTVPFHQLPALHDMARPHLAATSDGYAAFHVDYAARLTP